jgi:hypothetical protein
MQLGLSTDQEGFISTTSQRAITIKDMLIHIPSNAVSRGPGVQAGILGRELTAMDLTCIHERCHVKCSSDIFFIRMHCRDGNITIWRG